MRVVLALAVAAIVSSGLVALPVPVALAQTPAGSIRLEWTATGDDGASGVAQSYDIRYFFLPISEVNFLMSPRVPFPPAPTPAGTKQSVVIMGLNPGTRYYFAIKARDEHGNWSPISNVVQKTVPWAVGVDDPVGAPLAFSAPRPNPARGSAAFDLGLPERRPVTLEFFDLAGRRVRTMDLGMLEPGRHTTTWDLRDGGGRGVGAGLYLVRAQLGGDRFTQRVTVVR